MDDVPSLALTMRRGGGHYLAIDRIVLFPCPRGWPGMAIAGVAARPLGRAKSTQGLAKSSRG
jgi:hypothetical protein